MKKAVLLIALILFMHETHAGEFSAIDKKALQMPDSVTGTTEGIARYINANFHTDVEKSRAIYIWITTNFEYDISNMFAIDFYETKEDKIQKSLKTRKGICSNFSALFTELCLKSGIKSYVVEGYTKQYGFTDYIPHAWCAAYIDTAWYLFDPTWGSGYMTEEGKFFRRVIDKYFMAKPSTIIKSHMPFDYLWQFQNYIITNQEFYESKVAKVKRPYFNYEDSIREFDRQNHMEQLASAARRIELNGVKNSMIFDRLRHIKMEIEVTKSKTNVNAHNSAVTDYNEAINLYNIYIRFRNKHFIPEKSDHEIQGMIDSSNEKLLEARRKLGEITEPDATTGAMISQLNNSIGELMIQVKEQQDWLKNYLSKGKTGRKFMFLK